MPKIYNLRTDRNKIPIDAVLCDRSTVYGNPFVLGIEGNRNEVCDKYEKWINLTEQESLRKIMKENLQGKDLVCWCYPKRCHCLTIMRIVN